MADTPRLDLPYLSASQAQKEIMHNISLDRLDLLVQCVVLDRNLTAPPTSPALGDAYIVGAAPTGTWAGHANALALYINLQWQFIAPLPGFQCWVLDEAVQVGWSGSAWTIIASGGAGATTLLGLTDTPDSYGGQAGKTLLVNPGETGMVFGTVAGSAPVDATYIVSSSNGTLTAERVVTDNTEILWDTATAGQLKARVAPHGLTLGHLPQLPEGTLLGRGGTLDPVDDVQVITVGAGLALTGTTLAATGGGGGSSDFLGLTDTPDSYTGQAGKGVTVNGAATGLEFTTAVTGSYDLGVTWAGTLPASQVLLRYPFPRAVEFPTGLTGSRGVAATAATATTTLDLRKNGTSVGSVQYAASATSATFSMASATSFAAGDVLTVHAPGTADATLADLGLSLAGTRAVAAGEMGATTLLGLTDTPDVYASQALKILRVNAGETATEFGPVLGTMAMQNANNVDITGGKISIGGHASTGVLDVQGSVVASDIANMYAGIRLWPIAPSTAVYSRGIRIEPVVGGGLSTTDFVGVEVLNPPSIGRNVYGMQLSVQAGTNRLNINADGTAQNYFAGNVGIANSTPSYPLDVTGDARLTGLVGLGGAPLTQQRLYIQFAKATGMNGLSVKPSDSDTTGGVPVLFLNAGGVTIGSISTTATATAFNTSSDVRLKHSIAPLTGSLAVIAALNPVSHRWNVDDSYAENFLAHELQRVLAYAVTGEPDALNDDGSVCPQQVDVGKCVPRIVGAIKELLARVEALEALVTP